MKVLKSLVRLYYEVWADYLDQVEKHGLISVKEAEIYGVAVMTIGQVFNLTVIVFILYDFFNVEWVINIPSLAYWLPFILINFYLNVYKKNYKKYIENRKIRTRGIAMAAYMGISVLIWFIYILIGKLIISLTS